MHPAKTQISLGICQFWPEPSLSVWRRFGSLAIHTVHIQDSYQAWAAQADWSHRWVHRIICCFRHAQAPIIQTEWDSAYLRRLITTPTKMTVRPAKTQISLVAKDSSFLLADSEDSDQTGRMPRQIWVFARRTCHFVGFVMRRLICQSSLIRKHANFLQVGCKSIFPIIQKCV